MTLRGAHVDPDDVGAVYGKLAPHGYAAAGTEWEFVDALVLRMFRVEAMERPMSYSDSSSQSRYLSWKSPSRISCVRRWLVMITMAQLILCNRMHRLDQRAARWLLQVDDRVDEAPFNVTQEFLAQMIGVQRPALSVAMRQFKDEGLVRYARGQITIADREGLMARSCDCTRVIASESRRLDELLERADDGAT